MAELKSCNKIKNEKAWHFEIDNIPDKMSNTLDKLDDGVCKYLSIANSGASIQ